MTSPDLENLQNIEVPVILRCAVDKKVELTKRSSNINTVLNKLAEDGIAQWVMVSTGFKLRSEINKFFETNSIKGRTVFESDVMESLTRSVVDRIGVAFLPHSFKEVCTPLIES